MNNELKTDIINELIFLFEKYEKKQQIKILKKFRINYKNQVRNTTKKYMGEKNISFNKCIGCGATHYVCTYIKDYEKSYLTMPLCLDCIGKQHSKKTPILNLIDLKSYTKLNRS